MNFPVCSIWSIFYLGYVRILAIERDFRFGKWIFLSQGMGGDGDK